MKFKIAILVLILISLNFMFMFRYDGLDAISAATGSSSGSSTDKSQTNQKKHPSYALKTILTNEEKRKNEKVTAQLDNFSNAIEMLDKAIKNKDADIDIMALYLIVEENESLISAFTESESRRVTDQLKVIGAVMPRINDFLELYDKGETSAGSLGYILRDIETISTKYREIQWILYL